MRHLLYHIHPMGNWQWNLDQLFRHQAIFSGKMIFAVTQGSGLVSIEQVGTALRSRLNGRTDIGILSCKNDPKLGETLTLLPLLKAIQNENPKDIVFYGHAKGVTRGDNPAVKLWTEMQYFHNLARINEVQHLLEEYPIVGCFKKHGQNGTLVRESTWHYSGTFFWFRHGDLFSRKWWRVPVHRYGAEAYPSLLFNIKESGVIFGDHIRSTLYSLAYTKKLHDSYKG